MLWLPLASVLVSLALAAGPADLAALREGQAVGAFRAQAVYLDPAGAPKGARFLHERGAVVDVLFFDSVPQVSAYFRTPPQDDRGAPHTLEHLLLGKGDAGRRLNTLMPMRLGEYTAGTYSELTNYQFSSAAGPAEFYELLDVFLAAMIRPDFTDEEVRREVAHTAAVEESGRLKLEEKGTVYAEMVARMERPDAVSWDQLGRMAFGPGHPLALNQGGEPKEIWKLSPADIRAFHAAHYHLDGNFAMIAALPPSWSVPDFLSRFDAAVSRLEPQASTRAYAGLPPPAPLERREIRIGRFPSDDAPAPQQALLAWPPVAALTREEALHAALAMDLLAGGESSYLYGDLVDQKTRKLDSGATGVGGGVQVLPASFATLSLSGLPVSAVNPATLERLRDAVAARARWLHELAPGTPELAEAAEKARARIRAQRRSTLKSMDGPPGFGQRFTGNGWHLALDALAAEPGFAKPLADDALLDRLLAELAAGRNPWKPAVERLGLLSVPYVSAVLPEPALLERQRKEKEARLNAEAARLSAAYGLAEPQALERYRAEAASATAALESLERGGFKPSFLREPPLELDRIAWSEARLPSGPRLLRTRFDTAFTDISVAFDLRGIPEEDWELLPALGEALGDVGVVTRSGERLDYVKADERRMSEVFGAGVGVRAYPRSGRAELVFSGYASSPEEVDRAVEWIESYALRPALSHGSRERLVDLLRARIQHLRTLFQQDEESWVSGAAAAYEYQDRPLYMHASSPFTTLRHLSRLRWRLEAPAPAELAVLRSSAAAVLAAVDTSERAAVAGLIAGVGGEAGEYLGWEFSHLPGDSWRRDLRRVVAELLEDVGRSEETVRRLQALASRALVRAGARVHVNGNAENSERAVAKIDSLLARLPRGRPASEPKRRGLVVERLRERFPGLARPRHVALVNESGKTGTISVWTPAASYRSRRTEELLDALALGVLGGGGAHSLFLRTWSAGLAYGNGMSHSASTGRATYYADKCPDPTQTLRFVQQISSSTEVDDPFFVEYSLAGAFGDYRAGGDFSSRASSLAYDLEEGNRPETVRAYKTALLRLARRPETLRAVRARFHEALRRVLGLPDAKAVDSAAFLIAPEELVGRYESFVRERGLAERVIRLYPRDFWP